MNPPAIHLAAPEDLPAINDIYNWYVTRSTCTYQLELEPFEGRVNWFHHHDDEHPVTVATVGREIVGWGSLSRFHPRAAYAGTVEDSVYVRHDVHRKGVGRAILVDLVDRARAIGHHTVIGGISADQMASLRLHEALGFREVARLREVGFKFDRWLDVVYVQLML
jgi:phosphinothricin acetyltransferase